MLSKIDPSTSQYEAMEIRVMNSQFTAFMEKGATSVCWQEKLADWLTIVEAECSRFKQESALSELNRSKQGQRVLLPELLFRLLFTAWEMGKMTQFYFHPLLGETMEALGYVESFQPSMRVAERTEALPIVQVQEDDLLFYPEMLAVQKKGAYKVDLGGIGKGWSVDQAALWLKEGLAIPSGLVDGAGDMYVWSREGEEWRIGIADPWQENEEALVLRIGTGAVATSSKLTRRWQQGSIERQHIINGQTGLPADNKLVQATVLGSQTYEAEVLAKVLLMLPEEQIEEWMTERFPQVAYVIFREDGEVELSKNLTTVVQGVEYR